MKNFSLLKTQQYINYVGFLLVLISSTFLMSAACGDAFFPSKMPTLAASSVNKLVVFKENERSDILKMDYHPENDSLCLQLNDQCILPSDDYSFGMFISCEGCRNRDYIIDLRIKKDMPYKYVEELFNNLRRFNRRKLLIRTNTLGEMGGTTGVSFLLPPADKLYFDAMGAENQFSPSSEYLFWNPLFDNQIHVKINEKGALFYNETQCSQKDLLAKLKNDILDLKSKKKKVQIWLEINPESTLQQFVETYANIKIVYNDLWNEISLKKYGRKYDNLTNEEQGEVRSAEPLYLIWISNLEYQFLKKLEQEGKLKDFVSRYYEG